MDGQGAQTNRIEVRSFFVRHRNAMAVYGELSDLYVDYYLHHMQNGLKPAPEHDALLKDALAAMTLHLTARPQNEMSAWTINLREPVLNLFVTGDSEVGNVTGRVFTEGVATGERSLLYAQTTRPRSPIRQSAVEVAGDDAFRFVEQYYRQSEQLPARYFRLGDERFAMVVAQPDNDAEWFEALETDDVRVLDEREEVTPLEVRRYHWGCGCTLQTIHAVLAPVAKNDMESLYQGETVIRVQCPRCASWFEVEREGLERYLTEHASGGSGPS